jgi:dienelactone hydrolase
VRSRTRRGLGACLAAALLLGGCGGSKPKPSPFSYEQKAPIDLRDRGPANHGYPIVVHDISYASPRGGRVTAYLAVPPGHGPFPAVIYAHGSGGSRRDLLPDAVWMAARGAVTMTVDDPFARNPRLEYASEARQLVALVQDVVDLRRAVDVLESRPHVDRRRIAFVGFSLGARVGAVLAGAEPRIRAFDLMSGRGAPLGEAALDELSGARRTHARFFFQLGRRDEIVPRPQLVALANAAPQPKTVRWYDAGHALNLAAEHDQLVWLSRQLGLDGPVVAGALPGP